MNNRKKITPTKHVFTVGSKGMGNYGGYETFVAVKLLRGVYI